MMEPDVRRRPKEIVYFGAWNPEELGKPVGKEFSKLKPECAIKADKLIKDFAAGKPADFSGLGDVMPGLCQLGRNSAEKVRVIMYRLQGYGQEEPIEGIYVVTSVFSISSDKKGKSDMIRAVRFACGAEECKQDIIDYVERKRGMSIAPSTDDISGRER